MQHQLYMWGGTRDILIKRHRFYGDQVRLRVLAQFQDIEAEAKSFTDAEFERLGKIPAYDGASDMSEIANYAYQQGVGFYMLLDDLRKQTILGALAGMYHQWEKDLRDFIHRELAQTVRHDVASSMAWDSPNIGKIFRILTEFGWPVEQLSWYASLDACRLVVNVYKHGRGGSLNALASKFPEYLTVPGVDVQAVERDPNYQYLAVSDAQFDTFDAAITAFWDQFPERLYYPPQGQHPD